jgi:hypothetical protein
MEIILTKIMAFMNALLPPAVGSAVSIYIGREKALLMSKLELFIVFVLGICIAHYMGGATARYFDIDIEKNSLIVDAIKLTIGIYGMAIFTEFMAHLKKIINHYVDKVTKQ